VCAPDGSFIALPALDDEPFEKLSRKKVFDLLLKRGKIDQSLVTQMLGWNHSGFGVHHAVRLDADDGAGRERLAHYMLRCPFSLDRLVRVTEHGTVIYLAEKKACRRFPKPAGGDLFGGRAHDAQSPAPRTPSASAARRRWATLVKRVRHVDPLRCPTCGAAMKIVSFIEPNQPDLIQKILTYCGIADEPPRAPPQPPPQEIRELQYVSDLDFVQEPGPDEPV